MEPNRAGWGRECALVCVQAVEAIPIDEWQRWMQLTYGDATILPILHSTP